MPVIRFYGFEREWQQLRLGDVTERVQGNDGRMNLATLTISAVSGWLDQKERFSANIAGNEQKNYTLLSKGELSYNHGNSKLAKYGVVYVLRNFEEALVPRVYHSFRVNNRADADFIEYLFSSKIPDKELAKIISSGARMDGLLNISYNDFMRIKVALPQLDEQRNISSFFRTLDNYILLGEQELDRLKQMKQGLLQKMFPREGDLLPEIRFPGFDDDWFQVSLSDIAEIVGGGTPSTNRKEYWNGEIDWYSPSEIGTEIYANGSIKRITELGLKNSSAKILPADRTVLFTSRAGIGNMAILRKDAATNQGFQSLVIHKEYDVYFIYSMGSRIKSYSLKNASGSTFLEISGKMLGKMVLTCPSLEEQICIGDFFKKLDSIIQIQTSELDLLKQTKKAFLQKMFI